MPASLSLGDLCQLLMPSSLAWIFTASNQTAFGWRLGHRHASDVRPSVTLLTLKGVFSNANPIHFLSNSVNCSGVRTQSCLCRWETSKVAWTAINNSSQSTRCFRSTKGRDIIELAVELTYQQPFARTMVGTFKDCPIPDAEYLCAVSGHY